MAFSIEPHLPAPAAQPAPSAHLSELARLLERLGVGTAGRAAATGAAATVTRAQILQQAAATMLAPVQEEAKASARLLR